MMSEGGKKKQERKKKKKKRIPSEQQRVSDPPVVVDTQSYAVSDVPIIFLKKQRRFFHQTVELQYMIIMLLLHGRSTVFKLYC